MPPGLAAVALILFASIATLCLGACEPFLGQPKECLPIVPTSSPIETPAGGNQSTFAATASQMLPILNTVDPTTCGPTTVAYACSNYFRQCPSNASSPVQSGPRVCRSLCEKLLSDCAIIFTQFAAAIPPGLIPNCTDVDQYGTPLFPESSYNVTGTDGLSYTMQCNPGPTSNTTVGCIKPLVYHKFETIKCLPPCPRRFYSPKQMKSLKIVLGIFAFPAFLADLLMALLIGITPSRRRWPAVVPGFMFIGNMLAVIGFLIGLFGGYDKVWCTRNDLNGNDFGRQNDRIHPSCTAGAVFFIYGLEVFVLWWMWQAILIFETVFFPRFAVSPLAVKYQQIAAHTTAWGLPLVGIIIAGAKKHFGFAGDAPVCFYRLDSSLSNGLFWYPIIALTFVVAPLLIATVLKLAITGGWRALILQWRLLVMLIYSVLTYSLFCAFKFDLDRNENKYQRSMGAYVTCVMGGGEKSCSLKETPPFSLHFIFYLMWELTGVVNALICGLDREFVATVNRMREAESWSDFLKETLSNMTTSRSKSVDRNTNHSSAEIQTKTQTMGVEDWQ